MHIRHRSQGNYFGVMHTRTDVLLQWSHCPLAYWRIGCTAYSCCTRFRKKAPCLYQLILRRRRHSGWIPPRLGRSHLVSPIVGHCNVYTVGKGVELMNWFNVCLGDVHAGSVEYIVSFSFISSCHRLECPIRISHSHLKNLFLILTMYWYPETFELDAWAFVYLVA